MTCGSLETDNWHLQPLDLVKVDAASSSHGSSLPIQDPELYQELGSAADDCNPENKHPKSKLTNRPKATTQRSWLRPRSQRRGNLAQKLKSESLSPENGENHGDSRQPLQITVPDMLQAQIPPHSIETLMQKYRVKLPDPDMGARHSEGKSLSLYQDLESENHSRVCDNPLIQAPNSYTSTQDYGIWMGAHAGFRLQGKSELQGQPFSKSWAGPGI